MVVIIYCFIDCKERVSTWYLNGFSTLGQQYNVGEKPTAILYTYINRHADPPSVTNQKTIQYIVKRVVITYDKKAIDSYTNIGAWVNSKMSERDPPLYCIITLIAMEGHQTKQRQKTR